ncbi:MAG: dimethyl sulfoxide reductase anchor subunit family protein [Syntrophobacteraceae bacterium]
MSHFELPLVLFTVLSQAAAGVVWVVAFKGGDTPSRGPVLLSAAFLGLGLAGSLFHLGHPTMAPTALRNLGSAWLSFEILASGLFFACVLAGAVIQSKIWRILTSVSGALMVAASGLTYAAAGYPSHYNALPTLLFFLTAIILGLSWGRRFVPANGRPGTARLLGAVLLVALILNLAAPCLWANGSMAARMTAAAFASSPFFWLYLVAALGLPMVLIFKRLQIPTWMPVYLLAGELLGRMLFFGLPTHSAVTLGWIN